MPYAADEVTHRVEHKWCNACDRVSNSTLKAFTTEEQKPSQHFLTEWQFKKSSFVNNAVQSNDDALRLSRSEITYFQNGNQKKHFWEKIG